MGSRVPLDLLKGSWNKHKRLRAVVTIYLREVGDATTHDIFQHVNNNTKHGAVMNQLSNVLAKAPEFRKVGEDRQRGFVGNNNIVCRWGLAPETS